MRIDMVGPDVSIVIPAYNEGERIGQSLRSIIDFMSNESKYLNWEIIVANDGSNDKTADVVRDLQANDHRVKLLDLPHRGKGPTVRSGILASQGEFILFSDADLATPISEAERLFRALEDGADVAIGSRAADGAKRMNEPFYRVAMGYVFHFAVGSLLMPDFRDTQCGFKAFRLLTARDIFSRLSLYNDDSPVIKHPAVTGFDVEVLYLALHLGYTVTEVPVEWHYQPGSKVSPVRDSFQLFRDVLRVRSNARRNVYEPEFAIPVAVPEAQGGRLTNVRDDTHVA
jgi:dolichyl-phosphate beta-glucosyltransferase